MKRFIIEIDSYELVKTFFMVVATCSMIILTYAAVDFLYHLKTTMYHIQSELTETNRALQAELTATRKEVIALTDFHLKEIEKNTFTEVRKLNKSIDRILTNVSNEVSTLVDNTTVVANNTTVLVNDLVETSKSIRGFQADLSQRVKLFDPVLDCQTNDFCWQNLATDTMISARDMSISGSKAFNDLSSNMNYWTRDFTQISGALSDGVPKITSNVADITANVKRMTTKKWYDRILTVGLGAVTTAVIASK